MWKRLISYSKEQLPFEACGILSGRDNRIMTIYPLENIENSVNTFAIGEKDFIDTLHSIKDHGEEFNGVFHSHPTSPPYPSDHDVKNAYSPDIIYVIVSFANQVPQLEAYKILGEVVSKLEVKTFN